MVGMNGPVVRTDIVDVYVFRGQAGHSATFLQLRRAVTAALPGTWQPVMGHIEPGETAAQCAMRELLEETGYARDRITGFWQLEEPNIYFLQASNSMMLSPCFAVRVDDGHEPILNPEHDALRWIARDHVDRAFLWPGQRRAVDQIIRDLIDPDSPAEPWLRVP